MKPYSKKYLTLALAGVLAASMPVSAFANGPKTVINLDNENTIGDNETPKNEKEKNKTDAEKSNLTDFNYSLNRGERFYTKNISLPDGAKIIGNESFEYDKTGRHSEYVTVEFKDGSKKKIELNFKVNDRYDNRYDNITLRNVKYDGTYITGETSANAKIYLESTSYRY